MSDETSTVELPADSNIKQLAHDLIREDQQELAPLLLDFYKFLSRLEEGDATMNDLVVDDPESQMPAAAWRELIDTMEASDIADKEPGAPDLYSLQIPE